MLPHQRRNLNYHFSEGMTFEKMQIFAASLEGLSKEEIRKAKLLMVKNELTEIRALKAQITGFRDFAGGCSPFSFLFSGIRKIQERQFQAVVQARKEQLQNAIDVWREELGPDADRIGNDLRML